MSDPRVPKDEPRLVTFDPEARNAAREAVEKVARYELARRHGWLAIVLAALGLVASAFVLLRALFK